MANKKKFAFRRRLLQFFYHKKKNRRRRLKGEFELIFALAFAFLLAIGGIFIITRNYYLRSPEMLRSFLRENKIELSETSFQSRFFPYPHLYAPQLELLIDNSVYLKLQHVSLSPNYLSLLFSKPGEIGKVHVDFAELRVLRSPPPLTRITPLPLKKIKEIVINDIIRITHIVVRQFLLAREFTMNDFLLYVEDVNQNTPLVEVYDFILKRKEHIDISLKAYMGKWLSSLISIQAYLKDQLPSQSDRLYHLSSVLLEIQHRYVLEEIGNFFNIKPFPFRGQGEGLLQIEFDIPLKKIKGHFQSRPENVYIGKEPTYFQLKKSDNTALAFHFWASEDELRTDKMALQVGTATIWPELVWDFAKFSLLINFAKTNLIPGHEAKLILGDFFEPFLQYITTEKSYLKPHFFYLLPLEGKIAYRSEFILSSRKKSPGQMGHLALSGTISGNERYVVSQNLSLQGENTTVFLQNLRLSLGKERELKSSVDGELSLADFFEKVKGTIDVNGYFICRFPERTLDCLRGDFSIAGADLQIPMDNAVRFYRILSVDVFSYWKSLKRHSEITISQLNAQGYVQKDRLFIEKSVIDSDTGRIQLTGSYYILKDEGHFVLRLLPFGMDRVLEPIPYVGGALSSSLSLAAQMIYDIRYERGSFAVERFTMGTGFERLRRLFRN
ncbi:MAG: hypothetical protein NZM25_09785 [Leptospiraceae bacterium]|nr:hypothetical protein [Leptospiraceae bacterium]MDW8306449.1 hypothetical protein [Leptospiraceae bacterium]